MNTLYVIVPVLNEAGNIPALIASFRRLDAECRASLTARFILVDDGSRDDTGRLARAASEGLSLSVLTHPRNLGPGRAFATAFQSLAGRLDAADWVLTMEGDNTSRLELVRQMLTRANEGFDVVLASPYLYGGGIRNTALARVLLSHVANAFVKEFLGLHGIMTMSSFFRLYRGSIVVGLQSIFGDGIVERSGFDSMIELLLKLVLLRATISEVAMVLDTSQRIGKSKMPLLRTSVNYSTLWLAKGRWQRMVAALGAAPDGPRRAG